MGKQIKKYNDISFICYLWGRVTEATVNIPKNCWTAINRVKKNLRLIIRKIYTDVNTDSENVWNIGKIYIVHKQNMENQWIQNIKNSVTQSYRKRLNPFTIDKSINMVNKTMFFLTFKFFFTKKQKFIPQNYFVFSKKLPWSYTIVSIANIQNQWWYFRHVFNRPDTFSLKSR